MYYRVFYSKINEQLSMKGYQGYPSKLLCRFAHKRVYGDGDFRCMFLFRINEKNIYVLKYVQTLIKCLCCVRPPTLFSFDLFSFARETGFMNIETGHRILINLFNLRSLLRDFEIAGFDGLDLIV